MSLLQAAPTIRPLVSEDLPASRALRLRAPEEHPEAFGETVRHFSEVSMSELIQLYLGRLKNGGRQEGLDVAARACASEISTSAFGSSVFGVSTCWER